MLKLMSRSNLDCGFAVSTFVAVTYDWGEHDDITGLLISYDHFQHSHLAKRYVGDMI